MTSFLPLYFARLHWLSMCKERISKVRRADKSVNLINIIRLFKSLKHWISLPKIQNRQFNHLATNFLNFLLWYGSYKRDLAKVIKISVIY